MKILILGFIACILMTAGCANSYEGGAGAGSYSYNDNASSFGADDGTQPASLIEVTFGDGQTEVTKNLPADAVNELGDTIRSVRDKK